jgi:Glycosyl hydrolases family 16
MKIQGCVSVCSAIGNMWKQDEQPVGITRRLPAVNVFAAEKVIAAESRLKLWLGVCCVLLTSLLFSSNVYAQSPDGSTITPGGGTLTTTAGTWSFGSDCGGGNNYILLNSSATNACGTLLLVYNGGQMYADTSWYVWFLYSAPYFGATACDPRVIGSVSCTQLPDAQALVDSSGTTWTLSGEDSYENGTADGGSDISLLVYFNGNIYANTYSYGWFEHSSGSWNSIGGDPRGTSCKLSSSGAIITSGGGGTLYTSAGTWTFGSADGECGNVINLNGSQAGGYGCGTTLLVYNGGQMYAYAEGYGWFLWNGSSWTELGGDPRSSAVPYGVSAPSGYHWTMTFDDEFTSDSVINTSVWNGGGGNTDWCDFVVVDDEPDAQFFFNDSPNNPCAQVYNGLALDGSDPLQMTSASMPYTAIQTSGATENMATFIQQYGYWEASIKQPETDYGHSDFWMHAEPEGAWCPEFDVGERLPGDSPYTQLNFAVEDCGNSYNGGFYGASGSPDLGQAFHTYGMYWLNPAINGSGTYGSVQMYLDGTALFGSPYTLESTDTNLANGIYTFFSLDNGGTNDDSNAYQIQYVRAWTLTPN